MNTPIRTFLLYQDYAHVESLAGLAVAQSSYNEDWAGFDPAQFDILLVEFPAVEWITWFQASFAAAWNLPIVGLLSDSDPALLKAVLQAGIYDVVQLDRTNPFLMTCTLQAALERYRLLHDVYHMDD